MSAHILKKMAEYPLATKAFIFVVVASVLIFIINVVVWSIQPVYPDEILYRAFTSRALLDDWKRISFFPTCLSTANVPIPLIFYPAALAFSGYALFQDMQFYRYFGEFIFLCSLFFGFRTARHFAKDKNDRLILCVTLMALSALFIGALPPILVLLRPEHIIILTILYCCWTATRKPTSPPYLILLAIFLFYSMALYDHPKSIYFAPAILVAMLSLSRRWWPLQALSTVVLALVVGYGMQINTQQLLHCPENPGVENMSKFSSINPLDALKSPTEFVKEVVDFNFGTGRSWTDIVTKLIYRHHYDGGGGSGYLPASNKHEIKVGLTNIFIYASEAVTIFLALWMVLMNGRQVVRGWCDDPKSLGVPPFFGEAMGFPLVVSLFYILLFVQFFLNRNQAFYNIGFTFALLVFFNCMSLVYFANRATPGISRKHMQRIIVPLLCVHLAAASFSCLIDATTIFKGLASGEAAGIKVRKYDRKGLSAHVAEATQKCGLTPSSPRMVYDDLTYPYLQNSASPISVSWTFLALENETNVVAWLKSIKSSGIVLDCRSFGSDLHFPEGTVAASGPVCCVNLTAP